MSNSQLYTCTNASVYTYIEYNYDYPLPTNGSKVPVYNSTDISGNIQIGTAKLQGGILL